MSEPSSAGTTPDPVVTSAQKWVDSLTSRNQWRLQILSKRYRKDPATGQQVSQPTKIRRFAEGCPASGLKAALDYLISLAPYTGVLFNGQTLSGQYVPTITRWMRDDQDVVNNLRGRTDGTYTIVQDLIDSQYLDEYEFKSHTSCSTEVMSDYVWDSADIESIPPTGAPTGQGHTYAIQGVSRNEDGTLNYSLVHHHALTQHIPETVTENSSLRWASVEYWDNVYKSGNTYCDHNGTALTIPTPGVSNGTETKIANVSINDDCTLRIQVTREKANSAHVRQQSRHTIYTGDHEDDYTGALLPLPLAPEATGGVIVSHESQMQADGRYATKKGQRIERSVPQASVEVRVGFKGKRVTTVNKNQAAPASTSGISIGGSVKVEKTEGNLYDNTISEWDRAAPMVAGETCDDDLLSHKDSTTTSGISSIPTTHLSGGGTNGYSYSRRTTMDDEGAIIQVLETTHEKNAETFDEEWSVSLDGITHRTIHRNRSLANKGVAPTFSVANIGKTVRNEKTPGGLVNVTFVELDRNSSDLVIAKDCSKTIYEHADSSSTTKPNGTIPSEHVSAAGGGYTYDKQSRLNQNGSVTVVEKSTFEQTVSEAQKSFRRTPRGLITSVTTRNGTTPASDPGATAYGCSKTHEKTPGGRYNLTEVTLTASATQDSAHCRKTVFEHEHDTVTMGTGAVDTTDVADAGSGKHRTKNSELDSDGFVKTVVREVQELPFASAEVSYRRTARGLVTTTVDRNTTEAAADPGAGNVGNSSSHVTTDGGRKILTKVQLTPATNPDSARCEKTYFEHVHDTVTMSRGSVDATEVDAAGSGVFRTKTSDMDGDGFVKTVVRATTEIPRTGYEKTYRRTTKGLIVTTVDKSSSTAASDPGASAVGCSKSHRMTPGGLYDLTSVDITASANPDSAHCSKTMFEHVHDTVTMTTGSVDSTDTPAAGSGSHYVKTSDLDNDGFVKTVLRTTTEVPQTDAEKSYRRTARGLVTTTTNRNVSTTAADPGASAIGCSQAHRMNPGGTYDFTKVELTAAANPDSAYCSKTKFEHVHDTVTIATGSVDGSADVDDAANGVHKVKTQELDNDGFVKTVVRTTTELECTDARIEYESDHFTKTSKKTDRNVVATETAKDYVAADANSIVQVSVDMTPGGKKVKTETTVSASKREWDQEIDLPYSYSKTVWFVNATAAQKNTIFNTLKSAFQAKLTAWNSAGRQPSNHGMEPNLTLNRFGTFDGKFTVHASWHPESAGQTDTLNQMYSNFEYDRWSIHHDMQYNDGQAYIRTTKIKQHIYHEVGRGSQNYSNLCSGFGLFSLDAAIDPITKRYAVTKATQQTTYVTFEARSDDTASYTGNDTV